MPKSPRRGRDAIVPRISTESGFCGATRETSRAAFCETKREMSSRGASVRAAEWSALMRNKDNSASCNSSGRKRFVHNTKPIDNSHNVIKVAKPSGADSKERAI